MAYVLHLGDMICFTRELVQWQITVRENGSTLRQMENSCFRQALSYTQSDSIK